MAIPDLKEIDTLDKEIDQLSDIAQAISNHGINATSLRLLKANSLLASSSLSAIALESNSYISPQAPDSQMALEALLDSIKEKAAAWSAKILELIKHGKETMGDLVGNLVDRMKSLLSSVKDKVFASSEKTYNTIKAHPYKTLAAVAASAVAVIAIVTFGVRNMSAAKDASKSLVFVKKMSTMIQDIPWPFGKIVTTVSSKGKLALTVAGITAASAVGVMMKLGYSANSVEGLNSSFSKTGDGFKSIWPSVIQTSSDFAKGLWTTAKSTVAAGAEGARIGDVTSGFDRSHGFTAIAQTSVKVTGMTAGAAIMMSAVIITSVLYAMFKLISIIVIGGLRLACSTFNKLLASSPKDEAYF